MEPTWNSPQARVEAAARFHAGLAHAEQFFAGQAPVHLALRKLCAELETRGIPYAIAGGLALNAHGHRRVTVGINILLTREGLASLKSHVLGRGWIEKFPGSKGLKDSELGVTIDVLLAGEFPGDGRLKPIAFPDPAKLRFDPGPVAYLPLETFIGLKLASGISAPHRQKDLADIQELLKSANLPEDLADALDESVRAKYRELWALAQVHDPISET